MHTPACIHCVWHCAIAMAVRVNARCLTCPSIHIPCPAHMVPAGCGHSERQPPAEMETFIATTRHTHGAPTATETAHGHREARWGGGGGGGERRDRGWRLGDDERGANPICVRASHVSINAHAQNACCVHVYVRAACHAMTCVLISVISLQICHSPHFT